MDAPHDAVLPPWDGNLAAARALQARLSRHVRLEDDFPRPLRWIAGFDVGFEQSGTLTRAAAVLLDAATLAPHQAVVARIPTVMPYVPGLLSFRELPVLLAALAQLEREPDLVFVDGHGIAHPRRLGIAAHFGVVTGLPSIGVAKKRLAGEAGTPGPARGDHVPLRLRGEHVGWVLRSKPGCLPLYVSPGHRVSVDTALARTLACLRHYRLPEPTRLADRLASRRGEVPLACG
ncbi:deoxyribonuclease V [Stenotrophomonas sp. HITSZ_GD]|uniref:deoxyribonuclease V n=1 Tax=Stenotrophomonas sp. HITSZ_GD TaxID=3037248 RepID=UPI00240DF9AD|nr:deoxyribonuclease V [Stenotrophomonas sp. HITSZ_GD]MDG2525584.1 deoxyribonuclease V [Stenotrophomonas sp. HITSZ_GD]